MKIDLTKPEASDQLKAVQVLMLVMDPELGINIVALGSTCCCLCCQCRKSSFSSKKK